MKQETTDTTKHVNAHGETNDDVIVICDDHEIVVIAADIDGSDLPAGADDTHAADIDGSDLPAGADDKHGDLPAWEWCGSCETYPESGTCAECGRVYHRCDPCADVVFTADDLVIKHLELPLDLFIKSRM